MQEDIKVIGREDLSTERVHFLAKTMWYYIKAVGKLDNLMVMEKLLIN